MRAFVCRTLSEDWSGDLGASAEAVLGYTEISFDFIDNDVASSFASRVAAGNDFIESWYLANNAVVNVTQKVADWIEESLPVHANAENFGDPANGIEKQLKVDYTLDGVDGTMLIEEGQLLKIEK